MRGTARVRIRFASGREDSVREVVRGRRFNDDDDDDGLLFLKDSSKNRDKRTEEMKRADAKAKTFEERMEEIRRETDDDYSIKQRKILEKEKQNKKVAYKLGDRLPLPSESVVAEQYKLASEILTSRRLPPVRNLLLR